MPLIVSSLVPLIGSALKANHSDISPLKLFSWSTLLRECTLHDPFNEFTQRDKEIWLEHSAPCNCPRPLPPVHRAVEPVLSASVDFPRFSWRELRISWLLHSRILGHFTFRGRTKITLRSQGRKSMRSICFNTSSEFRSGDDYNNFRLGTAHKPRGSLRGRGCSL